MCEAKDKEYDTAKFEMELPLVDKPPVSQNMNKDKCSWNDRITLRTIWMYRNKDIMLKILVMLLYIADVFSDIILAIEYLAYKKYQEAGLTLIFVWVPSIFVTYDSYRRKTQLKMDNIRNICLCIPMVLFGIEPVLCYLQFILYAIKARQAEEAGLRREREKYTEQMLDQSRDVVDLKLYEGCMEAVPQLILQLSIILRSYGAQNNNINKEINDITLLLQVISVIFSMGGLALTIITWIQAVAIAQHCHITNTGLVIWSTGRLATLASRVLSVTGSVSIDPLCTVVALAIHWLGASFWHYYMYQSVYQNLVVSAAVGVLNTFLSRVDNVVHANVSHAILVIEDLIMIAIWAAFSQNRTSSVFISFLCLNIICVVMGTITSTIYIFYQERFMIGDCSDIKIQNKK